MFFRLSNFSFFLEIGIISFEGKMEEILLIKSYRYRYTLVLVKFHLRPILANTSSSVFNSIIFSLSFFLSVSYLITQLRRSRLQIEWAFSKPFRKDVVSEPEPEADEH